ncbi:hypothetical protein SBA5_30041 [Candidatus Sulfotelmatomonas gaucii]|uniref:Uncharacterized protein n=1 Tax=Candidatus Sulfuritelmatomonas gaucii TaxID=2043161 RepID=A0A2N9LC33_9BACT|nr:hypothetical protein SBA5_30041 [Candidatus Sulfotelmatomonas gaucii]
MLRVGVPALPVYGELRRGPERTEVLVTGANSLWPEARRAWYKSTSAAIGPPGFLKNGGFPRAWRRRN